MINKKILVIIHRGYNEFDWLNPIIIDLLKNNKIFFLFTNTNAFQSFSTDTKGGEFLKKSRNIILKKSDNLFYKTIRKIIKNLKFIKITNILNILEKKDKQY